MPYTEHALGSPKGPNRFDEVLASEHERTMGTFAYEL